jgi:Flp pilus assembly pilin Flp
MTHNLRRFLSEEEGLTSVEYALLLTLIVVVALSTWQTLSNNFVGKLNTISNAAK